jgi:hypothetical protein
MDKIKEEKGERDEEGKLFPLEFEVYFSPLVSFDS